MLKCGLKLRAAYCNFLTPIPEQLTIKVG